MQFELYMWIFKKYSKYTTYLGKISQNAYKGKPPKFYLWIAEMLINKVLPKCLLVLQEVELWPERPVFPRALADVCCTPGDLVEEIDSNTMLLVNYIHVYQISIVMTFTFSDILWIISTAHISSCFNQCTINFSRIAGHSCGKGGQVSPCCSFI